MDTKSKIYHTDFLYARPSFLEGLARVADFGNVLQTYNTSSTKSPKAARLNAKGTTEIQVGRRIARLGRCPQAPDLVAKAAGGAGDAGSGAASSALN
jgi:hypothetical protein